MDRGKLLLIAKSHIIEPLGIMFLSSTAKKLGYEVDFMEFEDFMYKYNIELFRKYNFVGFSINTGGHVETLNYARLLKNSGIKVIVGGHHPTNFPQEVTESANYIVIGEGLGALKNILEGGKEGTYSGYLTEPVEMGLPDRKLIYNYNEKYAKSEIKSVITSLGCPYSCSYCFNGRYKELYGVYKVRFRNVEDVIKECIELREYGTKLIYFQDDCFGIRRDWLLNFIQEYRKRVNIPFHCQTRFEFIEEEYLMMLNLGGCTGMTLAIESFNEKIRKDLLKRNTSNTMIYDGAYKIKKFGFKIRTEQMLGLPETTISDDLDLVKINCWIKPTYAWASTFVPFLGTPLGNYCRDHDIYSGNNDELDEHFFSRSRLNFSRKRINQIEALQNLFGILCKIPHGNVLAKKYIESDLSMGTFNQLHRRHVYQHELY